MLKTKKGRDPQLTNYIPQAVPLLVLNRYLKEGLTENGNPETRNNKKPHTKVCRSTRTKQHCPLTRSPPQLKVNSLLRDEQTDSDSSISPRAEKRYISPRAARHKLGTLLSPLLDSTSGENTSGSDHPSGASSLFSEVNTEDLFSSSGTSSPDRSLSNHVTRYVSGSDHVTSSNGKIPSPRPSAPSPDLCGSSSDSGHVISQEFYSLSSEHSTLRTGSVVVRSSLASPCSGSPFTELSHYHMVC